MSSGTQNTIAAGDHLGYMRLALSEAAKSPPKPSNFCVGAVLVDERANAVLATGFTLELPGNTHAEQCCLAKFASASCSVSSNEKEEQRQQKLADALPAGTAIYTTMEPCSLRLSGNLPCVDRILATAKGANGGIARVYVGVQEPEKFVGENTGRKRLKEAGIEYIHVHGLEDQILKVATAGHDKTAE